MDENKLNQLLDSVRVLEEHLHNKSELIDRDAEIINLWYEFTYLRYVLSAIMDKNPDLIKDLNDEVIKYCKQESFNQIRQKFSNLNIDFKVVPCEKTLNENKQELTSCIPSSPEG